MELLFDKELEGSESLAKIAECEAWVSNIDVEDGAEFLKLEVQSNIYGDQLGVGPHRWFFTEQGRRAYEMWGRAYTTKEEAQKQSLEYLNWLIPNELTDSDGYGLRRLLEFADLWARIRYQLGYNWNDYPTSAPTRVEQ